MLKKSLFKVFLFMITGAILFYMPACEKEEEENGDENGVIEFEKKFGTVTDIDNNEYVTIELGDQEWMAENLRVTRYRNGDTINTDLDTHEWEQTTEGAYMVYPHNEVTGLDTDAEMVEAYGKLYNWYTVVDPRSVCPAGWRVPSEHDWAEMEDFLRDIDGVTYTDLGNKLKSRRQDGTPLGGEFDTKEHPRWNGHGTHYGTDDFGFSGLPGGAYDTEGDYPGVPIVGIWWSDTELANQFVFTRGLIFNSGRFYDDPAEKNSAFSIRCVK